jgi:hypothetical protein
MCRYQFGIRTLFFLTVLTAFTIVMTQFLLVQSDLTFVFSLIFSGVSATVGVAMIALAALFAICIAATQKFDPLRKSNLRQCLDMVVMGLIAMGPALIFLVLLVANMGL